MADIQIHKNNGGSTPQPITTRENFAARRFEPFRMMRDLFRWDPFQEMAPVFTPDWPATFTPDFEVKETKGAYIFKADLPGLKQSDIDVSFTGNRLTVTGNRNEETEDKGDTYFAYERKYGSFSRSYTLPEGIDHDHIRADLSAGVLTIAVPKTAEVQAKKIAVTSNTPKG